ncbi:TRAP transporter small permease [Oceanobacillus halophilus]|uniref:TRAP transporter small permease n=1 Tax=Oceanobacillus halophilus TaxID=930130 RepID=A0A494ZT40_9BACI|nr:TRAP transporter small permease [Oceanobacillus halophilus]RKQ29285.1 TRAP transporter small permease [Oceanobacillus halophilus]
MKWLYKIEEGFLAISIISATAVLFINIILRYFFQANTTWAEEFIRYAIIWMTFLGSSVCFGRGLHVGIDFFLEYVNEKWRNVIGIYVTLVSIVLMVFLIIYGMELVVFSMGTGQITPSMQIKMYWIYLAIPFGAAISIVHLVDNLIKHVKQAKTDEVKGNNL